MTHPTSYSKATAEKVIMAAQSGDLASLTVLLTKEPALVACRGKVRITFIHVVTRAGLTEADIRSGPLAPE